MPIYEYRCTACEKEFEYQQRMADAPKTVCEACGGGLERIISRSAFHLKGGGWYKDLYASSKPDGSSGGGGGGSTSSASTTPAATSSDSGSAASSSASSDSGSSGSSGSSGGGAAAS